MSRTCLILDPVFLQHDPGPGHPESPDRIRVLLEWIESFQHPEVTVRPSRPVERAILELVHDPDYIDKVAETAHRPYTIFDPDTRACNKTYEVALRATGGWVDLLNTLYRGEAKNGFALVRPPGHHAERNRAMGFCFFNHIAIGATWILQQGWGERIAIIDWDLHHGNGTERIFFRDPRVLYISLHQFPWYPGSGDVYSVGEGDGTGFTINIPLPPGSDDVVVIQAFNGVIIPVLEEYQPDLILVSAGFDGHTLDPLGFLNYTEEGYRFMTSALMHVAQELGHERLALILEGGYHLKALVQSVQSVVEVLAGETVSTLERAITRETAPIDSVIRIHRQFWKSLE